MTRRVLPQRRPTFTFDMRDEAGRVDLTVAFSTFDAPGAPPPHHVAEVFITSRKIGSEVQAMARDCAVLLSLAVQHGCPLAVIRHALTRNEDGSAQSLMGRVVDRVRREAEGEPSAMREPITRERASQLETDQTPGAKSMVERKPT